jgi:hypothetical protein
MQATIIANLIGGSLFFFVDRLIFTPAPSGAKEEEPRAEEVQENGKN